MKTSIGITPENLSEISNILNTILADEYVLFTKTKNAHWNVEGPDFYNKHVFFEMQYNQLNEMIDNLAERIRTLNHYIPASLKKFLELTHLTEQLYNDNTSTGYIKELLTDHESIIIRLREHIVQFAETYKDLGTSDYITGLMETHEKMAWMLRSHLTN